MTNESQKSLSTGLLWTVGVFTILLLWAGSIFIFVYALPAFGWSEKGQIGDTFGAVNALFSGLAFLAVIITIHLQAKALRESKRDLDLQNFENKFFQLIRVHNDIVDGMEKPQGAVVIRGRRRFVTMYDEFENAYKAEFTKNIHPTILDTITTAYSVVFENNQHDLGHYFRNLYSIVVFIHRSNMPFDIKMSYIKLLRAQLSSHELLLLFYNCLAPVGAKKFKPLIEQYALLEHVPQAKIRSHMSLYDERAFKESNSSSK